MAIYWAFLKAKNSIIQITFAHHNVECDISSVYLNIMNDKFNVGNKISIAILTATLFFSIVCNVMYLVVIIRESTRVTLVHTKFQYRSFFRVFGHKTFFLQVGYSRVLLHILRELLMIWPHIHKKRVVFSSSSVKTFQIWMDVIFILPFDVYVKCQIWWPWKWPP